MNIPIGHTGELHTMVSPDNTAEAIGSGLVPVFGTPFLVALMEETASNSLSDFLSEGEGTVGTYLEVAHTAATPIGLEVWAKSEVTAVSGKEISFTISAFDSAGPIGTCTHRRYIIDTARFLEKANRKLV